MVGWEVKSFWWSLVRVFNHFSSKYKRKFRSYKFYSNIPKLSIAVKTIFTTWACVFRKYFWIRKKISTHGRHTFLEVGQVSFRIIWPSSENFDCCRHICKSMTADLCFFSIEFNIEFFAILKNIFYSKPKNRLTLNERPWPRAKKENGRSQNKTCRFLAI